MSNFMLPFPDKKITGRFNTRSAFRIRNGLGAHRGVDWAMPNKTPIPAVGDGTISLVHYSKVLGWCIVQTVFAEGKTWYVGYAHLAKKPTLKEGDKIKCGEVIGLLGNTGSASSGPHLHATLGTTRKSIFWGAHNKVIFDLHAFLKRQMAGGFKEMITVTFTPKNGNVVVDIEGVPVGMKARLRKNGRSVYNKTVKKEGTKLRKGVTLSTKGDEICVEVEGVTVECTRLKKGFGAGVGNDKVEKFRTRANYEKAKAASTLETKQEEKKPEPEAPKPVQVSELSQDDWKTMQMLLKRDHGYTGPVDGLPGPNTYKALQTSVKDNGYTGPIDGLPGPNTYKALQRRLVKRGTYEGRIDGKLGTATYTAWKATLDNKTY